MTHWLTWLIHVAQRIFTPCFSRSRTISSLLLVIDIFVQLIHCLSLCQGDRFPYLCYFPTGALGQAGHVTDKLPVSHQA